MRADELRMKRAPANTQVVDPESYHAGESLVML